MYTSTFICFKEVASNTNKQSHKLNKYLKLLWTVSLVNQGDSTCTFLQFYHTIQNGDRPKLKIQNNGVGGETKVVPVNSRSAV